MGDTNHAHGPHTALKHSSHSGGTAAAASAPAGTHTRKQRAREHAKNACNTQSHSDRKGIVVDDMSQTCTIHGMLAASAPMAPNASKPTLRQQHSASPGPPPAWPLGSNLDPGPAPHSHNSTHGASHLRLRARCLLRVVPSTPEVRRNKGRMTRNPGRAKDE